MPAELTGQLERRGLEGWPEEARDDRRMERNALIETLVSAAGAMGCKRTHRNLLVHPFVNPLRVLQILQHDIAALQRLFAESRFESGDVVYLRCE